jgi:hypothetical protein
MREGSQISHRESNSAPARSATTSSNRSHRVVELLRVSTNLENLSKKQQEMLHRSLGNEHLLQVLDKVAALSDDKCANSVR